MAENEGLRVTGEAIVLSLIPDFCKTPPSMAPVPYQILGRFSDGVRFADKVCMTSMNVMTMDSRLTTVYGDEAGTGGGILSGVNKGWCRPISAASKVSAKGHKITFHTSFYWMNCAGPDGPGNTIGRVTYVQNISEVYIGPLGGIVGDTNPTVAPETPEEKAWYRSAWDGVSSAAKSSVDSAQALADGAWHTANDAAAAVGQLGEQAWDATTGFANQAWDTAIQAEVKYKFVERGLGILGVVDGGKNVVLGVLASGTVVGAIVGVPVAAYGVDTVVANAKQIWTGDFEETYTEKIAGPKVDFAMSLLTPTNVGKKIVKEGLKEIVKDGAKTEAKKVLKQETEKVLKKEAEKVLEEGAEKSLKKGAKEVLEKGEENLTKKGTKKGAQEGVKVTKVEIKSVNRCRAELRKNLGDPPAALKNPQAHHDLPVKYQEQFAEHGIDINQADYGRWLEGTPPGKHQNWSKDFNKEWSNFFSDDTIPKNKDTILEKMNDLRADPRFQ